MELSGTVTTPGLERLGKKIDALAVRARRLRVAEPRLEIGAAGWREVAPGLALRVWPVTVYGDWPEMGDAAGWRFLAAVDHRAAGNLLRRSPFAPGGVTIPEEFRTSAATRCDGCGVRHRRKATYLLADAAGVVVQVGADCLKLYLPEGTLEGLLQLCAELGEELDSALREPGGGSAVDFGVGLVDFLAEAVTVVRMTGWVSRMEAREDALGRKIATADKARWNRWGRFAFDARRVGAPPVRPPEPSARDRERAEAIVAWVRAGTVGDNGDYWHNLTVACAEDYLDSPKLLGIVASAVRAYQRHLEVESERTERARVSRPVGVVGTRWSGEVRMVGEVWVEGQWGMTRLHKLLDPEGNALVWFGSGHAAREMEVGGRYKITGSVKEHGTRDGVVQTHLVRVTVAERLEVPERRVTR